MAVPDLDCGRIGPYAYRLVMSAIHIDRDGPFTQEHCIAAEGCLDAPTLLPMGGVQKTHDGRRPITKQYLGRE